MMKSKSRYPALFGSVFLTLGISLIAVAAQLDAPVIASTELLLPARPVVAPPKITQRLEAIVQEQYPQVWQNAVEGIPVVTILFAQDGTVQQSEVEVTDGHPGPKIGYGPYQFLDFGLKSADVGYTQGEMLRSPVTGKDVYVRYGERKTTDDVYQYFVVTKDPLSDRRAKEREIMIRYFPEVLANKVTEGQLWVLLNSEGRILRTGQELLTPEPDMPGISSRDIVLALRRYYPDFRPDKLQMSTATGDDSQPLKDRNGHTASITYMWLKPDAVLSRYHPADTIRQYKLISNQWFHHAANAIRFLDE